jgi:hypothetical protein
MRRIPQNLVQRPASQRAIRQQVVKGFQAGRDRAIRDATAAKVGRVDLQKLAGMTREELHRVRFVVAAAPARNAQARTPRDLLVSTHFRSGPTSDCRL